MSLPELLGLLPFAPATRSHSRPPISLHKPEFSGPPRSLHCVDPKVEWAQQKTPPMRAFAQRGRHSRASVARHEQLAIFSVNRVGPSVNIQVRLKYQDFLKNPVELGPGMHHRSARLTRLRIPRPQGSRPALARSGQSGCVRPGWVPGPAGPRGRRHGRPLRLGPPCGWPAPPRWPRSCWRPTGERPKDSRRRGATPAVVARIEPEPRSL